MLHHRPSLPLVIIEARQCRRGGSPFAEERRVVATTDERMDLRDPLATRRRKRREKQARPAATAGHGWPSGAPAAA